MPANDPKPGGHRITIGRYTIPMPASKAARIALGVALLIGGILGFLPVLGFWMFPLGLVVLSIDLALARRLRRKAAVYIGRRRKPKNR